MREGERSWSQEWSISLHFKSRYVSDVLNCAPVLEGDSSAVRGLPFYINSPPWHVGIYAAQFYVQRGYEDIMIIQCDQCETRFRLDDSKVSGRGVRVKCTKCSNLFVVTPPEPEAEPEKVGEESFQPTAGGGEGESSEGGGGFDFGAGDSEAGERDLGGEEKETTWEDAFGSTDAPEEGEGAGGGESLWDSSLGGEDATSGTEGDDLGVDLSATGGEAGEGIVTGSGDVESESDEDLSSWEIGASTDEGGPGGTVMGNEPEDEAAAFSIGDEEERTGEAPSAETGGGDFGSVSEREEMEGGGPAEESAPPFATSGEEGEADDFIIEDEESDAGRAESAPPRGSKVKVLLLLLLILLGAAFYFTGGGEKVTNLLGTKEPVVEKKPLEIVKLNASSLENSTIGALFVIEGHIMSLSDKPVPVKGIKGEITNREGRKVGAKVVPPGRIISKQKLALVTKGELEERFRGKTSSQIPSKGSVPFMIIFPADMTTLDEYSVEVLR